LLTDDVLISFQADNAPLTCLVSINNRTGVAELEIHARTRFQGDLRASAEALEGLINSALAFVPDIKSAHRRVQLDNGVDLSRPRGT